MNAQKAEVLKVGAAGPSTPPQNLEACARLEKERRALRGTLERSFSVVEAWLGEALERDFKLKAAFDTLVRLHSTCADVTLLLRELDELGGRADEFQDQIELFKQQALGGQLDRLFADIDAVQRENLQLEQEN